MHLPSYMIVIILILLSAFIALIVRRIHDRNINLIITAYLSILFIGGALLYMIASPFVAKGTYYTSSEGLPLPTKASSSFYSLFTPSLVTLEPVTTDKPLRTVYPVQVATVDDVVVRGSLILEISYLKEDTPKQVKLFLLRQPKQDLKSTYDTDYLQNVSDEISANVLEHLRAFALTNDSATLLSTDYSGLSDQIESDPKYLPYEVRVVSLKFESPVPTHRIISTSRSN